MAIIDDISALYVAYFNRAPDPAGLQFWIGRAGGVGGPVMSLVDIANSFAVQPEATGQYGFLAAPGVADSGTFLASVYLNLFGRVVAPTATELDYWKTQLANPAIPVGRVLLDIRSGALGPDLDVINNKTAVAKAFAQADANTPGLTSLAQQQGALADVTADTTAVAAIIAENTASLTDTTAPVVTAAQTFSNAENKAADALLGTVLATDTGGSGVGSFAITTGNTDGFFAIAADGKITLTAAGAAATSAANDFEKSPNTFVLGVTATDKAGNVGAATNVTLNVTDVDDTAPKFVAATAAGTTVKLNFDEALKAATLSASTFTVVDAANASITLNSVAVSGSSVTLTLATAPSGTVKVSYNVPATGDVLQDAAGNKVAAIVAQSAVTDVTVPTLSGSSPGDNATNFSAGANLVLTFSENVTLGTGNIVIVNAANPADTRTIAVNDPSQVTVSGAVVTINPTADLTVGAAYNVTISNTAIVDAAGNAYVGISNATDLNFTAVTTVVVVPGVTVTLTSATDNTSAMPGTAPSTGSGDDLIIGEISATSTINVSDQINGLGGNDTFRAFGAFGQANVPATFSNVEIFDIVTITNASFTAAGIVGLTTLQLTDATLLSGQTVTTAAGVNLQMATAGGVGTTGAVTFATSGATSNLVLNGYQGAATATPAALTVTNATAGSTLNITSQGGANATAAFTGPALTTTTVNITAPTALTLASLTSTGVGTLNVSGAGKVTINASDLAATLAVNGAANTGGITYVAEAAGSILTFTGGSGNDTVNFAATTLTTGIGGDVLNAGAGTDTLGINDTALAGFYSAINATTGFEILALGTTAATVDVAQVAAGIVNFQVTAVAAATFNNALNTTGFILVDNANTISGTVLINNAVGQGTTNVTLSNTNAAAASATIAALNFTGVTTVNLASTNNGLAGNTHIITAVGNADNTAFNITGGAGLTLTLAAGTAVGSSVNASALTGALNVTGSNFGDVLTGGTGADFLSGIAGADTSKGNAGNDTFFLTSTATTQLGFAAGDSTTGNIDKILDFTGNGALAGDTIMFAGTANVFGAAVDFTAGTTTTVTAVTVTTASTFTALAAAIQTASAGVATSSATAQVYDVTVSGGTLAGRFMVLNDDTAAIAATDTFVSITGVTGALNAQDFTYGA